MIMYLATCVLKRLFIWTRLVRVPWGMETLVLPKIKTEGVVRALIKGSFCPHSTKVQCRMLSGKMPILSKWIIILDYSVVYQC